jgi:hypothetical protein
VINSDDYIEIVQRDALFVHIMDRHEWDRLGEVWAEDGGYDGRATGRGLTLGLAALREYFSTSRQPLAHVHTNHDFAPLEEAGSVARGRFRWFIVWEDNGVSSGYGEDVWKKTPNGWRLHRRATRQLAQKTPA